MDEATDPWGIKVDRVEIKDIDLGDFGRILAEQRAAETKRRTEITEAEGKKKAEILRAEGDSESRVLTARAEKEAVILRAEAAKQASILAAEAQAESTLKLRQAEAAGLQMLQRALAGGDKDEALLRFLQIQQAGTVGRELAQGQATKFFLPADIANLFGMVRRSEGS
jgi:regulator of protease activity HflC (stomatin/prohibitin superfamily)